VLCTFKSVVRIFGWVFFPRQRLPPLVAFRSLSRRGTSIDPSAIRWLRLTASAYGFGCFWGVWLLFALYLTAFARRSQLTVTDDRITHKGVFGTDTTPVAAITALEWLRNPDRVVVRYPRGQHSKHPICAAAGPHHGLAVQLWFVC
jgi:hypothetical protein